MKKGRLTLNDEVEWEYQRSAAEVAVRSLLGLASVTNRVIVKPKFTPADVEARVLQALERQTDREPSHIHVVVNGTDVNLSGRVHSWAECRAVQGVALLAPGVANVVNKLLVEA